MMKNIIFLIFIGVILAFTSCSSQSDIYEDYLVSNGLIYPGPAQSPTVYSGNNRVKISWLRGNDKRVEKAKVFWNNYTDSVELQITADMDTVSYTIDPISENTYSFMIHTYDNEGNKSIPTEVLGIVYGDSYKEMLTNRLLINTYYDGQDLKLNWGTAATNEMGVDLNWTDLDGKVRTSHVGASELEILLPNYNIDIPLYYSTAYKPDSLAIDTFYAEKVELKVDPVVKLPKQLWLPTYMKGDLILNSSYPLKLLWDNNTNNFMHSADPITLPSTFTWDLGLKAKLDRMTLWPRKNNDDRWNRGQPRVFEIFGSMNPNSDGSLDASWTLLGRFEAVPPSGNGTRIPWQSATSEDISFSDKGIDFKFVPNGLIDPNVTVRFIRFRSLEHFNSTQAPRILLAEISLWGTIVK